VCILIAEDAHLSTKSQPYCYLNSHHNYGETGVKKKVWGPAPHEMSYFFMVAHFWPGAFAVKDHSIFKIAESCVMVCPKYQASLFSKL